jgi:EAL domain-containing protein (putative c-di-GMP-specific phosphodiesterase class I)
MVVSEVVRRLTATDFRNPLGDSPIAINLFPQSIGDTAFTSGLVELLSAHPQIARHLMFELHEHGASSYAGAMDGFITQIHALGAKVGLDQFGRGFSSVDYLSTMKIDYVRIDGSFTRGIDAHTENQFFVDSLVKVAHGLDITVYAESVETDQEATMLRSLRVDGLKGYGLVKPSEWASN